MKPNYVILLILNYDFRLENYWDKCEIKLIIEVFLFAHQIITFPKVFFYCFPQHCLFIGLVSIKLKIVLNTSSLTLSNFAKLQRNTIIKLFLSLVINLKLDVLLHPIQLYFVNILVFFWIIIRLIIRICLSIKKVRSHPKTLLVNNVSPLFIRAQSIISSQ